MATRLPSPAAAWLNLPSNHTCRHIYLRGSTLPGLGRGDGPVVYVRLQPAGPVLRYSVHINSIRRGSVLCAEPKRRHKLLTANFRGTVARLSACTCRCHQAEPLQLLYRIMVLSQRCAAGHRVFGSCLALSGRHRLAWVISYAPSCTSSWGIVMVLRTGRLDKKFTTQQHVCTVRGTTSLYCVTYGT